MQAHYRIHAGLYLLVLIMWVFVDPGAQAMAQAACEQELTDGEQAYTFGRFDEAIQLLNRCLDKRNVTETERQRAYRLIGLSYLGKDLLGEARSSVRRLLELVPDYRPDPDQDPPPFVEMVEDVRREMRREPAQEEPTREEPTPVTQREKRRGISKWVWIGGGAVLAGVAAAVLLSGGGGDGGNGNGNEPPQPTTLDEVEPNNSTAQAQVLRGNPPITVRGNIEVSDVGALEIDLSDFGIDDVDDLEDLYRVTLTGQGLRLTLSGLAADCDLYLLDAQATAFISNSIGEGTATETINEPNLAAGTYLIGITIFDLEPLAQSTGYTLVVDGLVSGSSQRVAVEHIHGIGGAALASDFRLVAHAGEEMPLSAALPNPADVAWTAYHDNGGTLVEYDGTDLFHFRPGRGFWVQSTEPVAVEAPLLAAVSDAYALPLQQGWNIISNPFDAPLDWSAVQEANGVMQSLWRWDGHFVQAATFAPSRRGEAYYYLNLTRRDALTIPHPSTTRMLAAAHPHDPSTLTLSAYREGHPAATVRVGFAADAAPGIDAYDQFAPPGYFEAASLRLVRRISSERRVELASEFRPWGETGQQFDLVLKAPEHAPIELRADGLEAFAGYDVYLVDQEEWVAHDLRARPVLNLTAGSGLRRFTLVVGDATYTRAARAALVPEAVHLSNYPNPFNPHTKITYTVPATAAHEPIRLEVFNAAGQRVRLLVEGMLDPGTYEVTWDGTDAAGAPVASGVYLYRLRAGVHSQVRQMLLMK